MSNLEQAANSITDIVLFISTLLSIAFAIWKRIEAIKASTDANKAKQMVEVVVEGFEELSKKLPKADTKPIKDKMQSQSEIKGFKDDLHKTVTKMTKVPSEEELNA